MFGMAPEVLLWDFGDTLVDERWMRRCPDACPGWEDAWTAVMADLADRWNVGAVRSPEVFAAVAARTGMTSRDVESHARDCCGRLAFNPAAWRVAVEHRLPQALVTVNPDLFADDVVPAHELAVVFDVIVVSFAEGTADKPSLCRIALDRLGFVGDRSAALLIDDRNDLVHAWQQVGGAGYWFRSDEQFRRDIPRLLGPRREPE
jgi:FMN phosphatase YigB (HAD superfamily)